MVEIFWGALWLISLFIFVCCRMMLKVNSFSRCLIFKVASVESFSSVSLQLSVLDLTPGMITFGGTRWCSWLRHCTTSRKVTDSIPDCVIGIFHWHNPSDHAMALGLTQPLIEMSTRNISWGYRRPVRRADNLTTFMCQLSWNLRASTFWNPQGLSRPVMGLLYLYLYDYICQYSKIL